MFAGLLQDFYEDLLEQGVPDEMAALVRQIPDGGAPARGSRRIALVAEPDPDLRALAAALLEETELAVIECTSAEAALAILQRNGEHVAFLFADETLAGPRDGLDLARSAATLWPQVHVVVTTSSSGRDGQEPLPEGIRALRKPWRGLDVLLAAERAVAASKIPG
ncbi:response regulator [Enterovirga sp. DB1703]|uniref:Response regulator n=1 Tax=Enterovirga aerilata TaxID=2730920 RepID=A0A849I193_9HYPH|nr:response regulator [Enterovirga sp. DB1703]